MKRSFPSHTTSLTLASVLALSGTLALGACQVQEGIPAVPVAVSAADAPVKLVLRMPRELLSLQEGKEGPGNAYTRADIDHVTLSLVLVDDTGDETQVSQATLEEFELAEDVVFEHLNGNRHYRVKARAYADPDGNELISVEDERSWTEVETSTEQNVTVASLKVKLKSNAPLVASLAEPGTEFGFIDDMVVNADGDLFLTEGSRGVIWRLPAGGGPSAVYAGQLDSNVNSPGTSPLTAGLDSPDAIAVDALGNVFVSVSDGNGNSLIRWVRPNESVDTLMDEEATSAKFEMLRDLAVLSDRSLLAADLATHRIYKFPFNGTSYDPPVVFAGSGDDGQDDDATAAATFSIPNHLAVGPDDAVYVADRLDGQEGEDDLVRVIRDGEVRTLETGEMRIGGISGLARAPHGHLFVLGEAFEGSPLMRLARNGSRQTFAPRIIEPGEELDWSWVGNLASGPNRKVFVAEGNSEGNYRIWKIQ